MSGNRTEHDAVLERMATEAQDFIRAPGLQALPTFDFDDSRSWTTWLEQYEDYAYATDISRATEETR